MKLSAVRLLFPLFLRTQNAARAALMAGVLMLAGAPAIRAAGEIDPTFDTGTGFTGQVHATARQSDGQIIVGGGFTQYNGTAKLRIARLSATGTLDAAFTATADGIVYAIAVQTDGKIVIGGSFSNVNSTPQARIARLNSDGTLDATFTVGTGFNSQVEAIVIEGDGRIVAGGSFTTYNSQPKSYLTRLSSTGVLEGAYPAAAPDNAVLALVPLVGGKLLAGGAFTNTGTRPRRRVARFNTDGSVDTAFDPGAGANSNVNALAVHPAGGYVAGGSFGIFNGVTTGFLTRLTDQGVVDAPFALNLGAGANTTVTAVAVDATGRIVAGGNFTTFNNLPRNRMARVLADGRLEVAFTSAPGADATVNSVTLLPGGAILVGGNFQSYQGQSATGLVQLIGASTAAGGEIEFSAPTFTITESGPAATITVTRSGLTAQTSSAAYATANGTANAGDYEGQADRIESAPGETSKTFMVPIFQDTEFESPETVLLTLSDPQGGAVLGGQTSAMLTITDDDAGAAVPGEIDAAFLPAGANGQVIAMTRAADGKLLVGGNFSIIGGMNRNRIARLNADGTVDTTFNPAAFVDSAVNTIVALADGRVVVGGNFSEANAVVRSRMARLRADGTLDAVFNPAAINSAVNTVVPVSSGRYLIGGSFNTIGSTARPYFARLLSDGTLDTAFTPAAPDNAVQSVAVDANGKMLLGGVFTRVGNDSRRRIARLLADGSVDPAFHPGQGANSNINVVVPYANAADGILVGGAFSQFNGVSGGFLVRLTAGGQVDAGFHSRINGGPNTTIHSLAIGDNGKIVAGGSFTTFAGAVRNRLVRLLADGTLDTGFAVDPGADASVDVVAVLPGGKVLAGGNFVNYSGLGRARLVLINGTGAAPGGEIEFSATQYGAAESSGQATIEVRRSGITTAAASVAYATANGTANAADYTARTGTLNFAAGETLKSFTVPVLEDTLLEAPESVNLTLSNPGGGSILGVFRTATLTIDDNETDTHAGAVDQSYGAQGGANGPIHASLAMPDGTVVVGGNFSFIGGLNRNRLARLLADGTVDPAFNPAIAFDGQVHALALQDGKIYAGGNFGEANAEPAGRIVRLNADGTRDTGFTVGAGFNGSVNAILPLADGRVVVAGSFSFYQNQSRSYLTRLLGDGGIDETFVAGTGPNSTVEAAALTGDGKILIGGSFTAYGAITRNRVARVLANGGLDTDFDPGNGPNSTVHSIFAQPDGKVLIGGIFTQFAGGPAIYVVRLLNTGARDVSFSLDLPPSVTIQSYQTMTRAADGQIYLAGQVSDGVTSSNRIIRLSQNGAYDFGFGARTAADQRAYTLLVTPGDTLLVGGSFTTYNGLPRPSLVRIGTAGAAPSVPVIELVSIVRNPTGTNAGTVRLVVRGVVGRRYSIQTSPDLGNSVNWTTIRTGDINTELFQLDLTGQTLPKQFYRASSQ